MISPAVDTRVGSSAASEKQLFPLTSLRFFAALYVVSFHFARSLLDEHSWFAAFLKHGWASVYFFFVLSGFVLGSVYCDAEISPKRFWALRLFRIYPMHLLALLLLIPFNLIDLPEWFPENEHVMIWVSVLLLVHGWSGKWWDALNFPSWSLSAEAFFYALFPGLNWLMKRVKTYRGLVIVGLGCVGLFGVLALVPAVSGNACPPGKACTTVVQWALLKPIGSAAFFFVGIVLGRIFAADRRNGIERNGTAYFFASLAALVAIFWSGVGEWDGQVIRAMFMPAFALLVFGAAHARGPLARALSARPLVYLGDISYSFYILQLPVLWAVTTVMGLPIWELSQVGLAVYFAALLVASMISYRLVETPMRTLGRRLFNRKVAAAS